MKTTLVAVIASIALCGCTTTSPVLGYGGKGTFQSNVPLAGLALELSDSFTALGYDVSIETNSVSQRTITLKYPSRAGRVSVSTDPADGTRYTYSYRLNEGVWDHHGNKHKDAFLRSLNKVVHK